MKIPGIPAGPGTPESVRSGQGAARKSGAADTARREAGRGVPSVDGSRGAPSVEGGRAAIAARPAGSASGQAAGKTAAAPPAGSPPAAGRAPPAGIPAAPNHSEPALSASPRVGTPEQAGTDRLHSLLSALKLPADSLSANLISFCRYFSLPLESASLGVLRREILVQKKREAAALGSAAAAGKGLVLESRALEEYAGAIDPAQWQEEQDAGQNGQYTPGENSERDRAKKEDTAPKLKAGDIEETVTKTLKNRPPLDFINRIPGKNGRRWVVVPFSFSGDGMDIKASFRILLADPSDETSRLERFAADIAVFREKELSRRWFLLLEGTSGRVSAELPGAGFTPLRAEFSVFPPLPEEVSQGVPGKAAADVSGGKSLAREIAKTFALPVDKIQAGGGNFADSRNDLLRTVDEEV